MSVNLQKQMMYSSKIFLVIGIVIKDLQLSTRRIFTNSGEYQDSKHLNFHLISE